MCVSVEYREREGVANRVAFVKLKKFYLKKKKIINKKFITFSIGITKIK